MEYNLLICASAKQWVAIDINENGECDRISFDGNEIMEVDSKESVTAFCSQIYDYYNIVGCADIEINVKIVMISEYSNLIEELFLKIKEAKSINIIDLKSILPIYVLKNCVVKPGGIIDVRCMEENFTLQVDDSLVVSYISKKAGEEIVITPECFSLLFKFDCSNLISDEEELKTLEEKCAIEVEKKQKEIDEQKNLYSELMKKYDELETLYKEKEEKTKLTAQRVVLGFTLDKLTGTMESSASKTYGILGSMSGISFGAPKLKEKYVCRLLKTDGDIVKKGTPLVEITEWYGLGNDTLGETGRKAIIKSKSEGRIFYPVKNGNSVKDGQAVVLMSDPADRRADVMKWFNEMK